MLIDEQLLEASRLSETGDESGALNYLLELEQEHPDDPTLLCMVGALAAHLGSDGMAVDYFQRCLAQNPTKPEILVIAGSGLAESADPAAEPALRLAALTAPDLPAARMHYGAYLARIGLLEQGLAELLAARELDPDDPDIRRYLGTAYLLLGRGQDALDEFESASSASDEPEVRLLLGLVLLQEGEISRAAEELHAVGETLADDAEVQILLALAFGVEGWEEEAWIALSRAEAAATRLDPVVIRDVEEALEAGEEAARSMLVDEVAPTALRDRLFTR